MKQNVPPRCPPESEKSLSVWEMVLERGLGLPRGYRYALAGSSGARLLQKCFRLEVEIAGRISAICARLEVAIRDMGACPARKGALNLKRDIYNRRFGRIRTAVEGPLREQPGIPAEDILRLVRLKSRFDASLAILQNDAERSHHRFAGLLHAFGTTGYFQAVSVLCCDDLRLNALAECGGTWSQSTNTLFRFWLKAAYKVSPFSSFGRLQWRRSGEERDVSPYSTGEWSEINGRYCSLNVSILPAFRAAILEGMQRNQYYDFLTVGINPTVTNEGKELNWFCQRRLVDTFCAARATALLVGLLERRGQKLSVKALVATIANRTNVTESQARGFTHRLLSEGFIELDWSFSALSPTWTAEFRDFLDRAVQQGLDDSALKEWDHILRVTRTFGRAGVGERKNLLRDMLERICRVARALAAGAQASRVDLPAKMVVYEDVFHSSPHKPLHPTPRQWRTLELISVVGSSLSISAKRKRILRSAFLERYGETARVPFLRFYRHIAESGTVWENLSTDRTEIDPSVRRADEFYREFFKRKVRLALAAGSDVDVTVDELEELEKVSRCRENRRGEHSYAAMLQQSTALPGALVLVSLTPGYGRAINRFIHQAGRNSAVLGSWRHWLNQGAASDARVEIGDCTIANADVRFPSLRGQILIPGADRHSQGAQGHLLSDLEVFHDPDTHRLILRNVKTGHELHPQDISLISFGARTKCYKLLSTFGESLPPAIGYLCDLKLQALRESDTSRIGMWHPRFTVDQSIILTRAAFDIPLPCLRAEVLKPGSSEAQAMVALFGWMARHRIPSQCYVKHYAASGELPSPSSGADNKPFYFDANSFISLRQLLRLCQRQVGALSFVEADPNADISGANAAEYVWHWRST